MKMLRHMLFSYNSNSYKPWQVSQSWFWCCYRRVSLYGSHQCLQRKAALFFVFFLNWAAKGRFFLRGRGAHSRLSLQPCVCRCARGTSRHPRLETEPIHTQATIKPCRRPLRDIKSHMRVACVAGV